MIDPQHPGLTYENDALVRRYMRDHDVPEERARHAFEELKKFLVLCTLEGGTGGRGACAPSQRLDEIWHAFVLHTRAYEKYCRERLGRVVHHNPTDGPESDLYVRTRETALRTFGALDPEFWPMNAALAADCNGSCSGDSYCSDCSSCNSDGDG
jgi:hypothetical protein